MRIRFFEKEDLPAILAIQKKAPQAAQWQAHDYSRLAVLPGGMILVADLETVTPIGLVRRLLERCAERATWWLRGAEDNS